MLTGLTKMSPLGTDNAAPITHNRMSVQDTDNAASTTDSHISIQDTGNAAPTTTNPIFTTAPIENEVSSYVRYDFHNGTILTGGGEDVIRGNDEDQKVESDAEDGQYDNCDNSYKDWN